MIRLLYDRTVGKETHRGGWPNVLQVLRRMQTPGGMPVDDFVDHTFAAVAECNPQASPWVGIFHHPPLIRSPLYCDRLQIVSQVAFHPCWPASARHLAGAVTFSGDLAALLRRWLPIFTRRPCPVVTLKHPTDRDVQKWSMPESIRLLQVGFAHRNTRAIYQIPPRPGYQRCRLAPSVPWHHDRDKLLRKFPARGELQPQEVLEILRCSNAEYDRLLSESVVFCEYFGAAASNTIIECIARATPIVVNRLPAIKEYLGADYPLFYDDLSDVPALLNRERIAAAHEHLRAIKLDLSFETFADSLRRFVESLP